MRDTILAILNEVNIASFEELRLILKGSLESVRKKTLENNLLILEHSMEVFRLLPGEADSDGTMYILGPNAEVKGDLEVRELITESGVEPRELSEVRWDHFSKRTLTQTLEEVGELKENILSIYKEPKRLEIDYFDLSLKYHQLMGFFNEKYTNEFLLPVQGLLRECRGYLDKMEFG